MNLLQLEDTIKGLPNQKLMEEAQNPTGYLPQFLLVSEVQRRAEEKNRYKQDQAEMPKSTIADQILNGGIMQGQDQMRQPPPNQPFPLPTGPGISPNPNQFPPPPPPNAEIAPRPQGMAGGGVVYMEHGGTFPANWQGMTYDINRQGYDNDLQAWESFLDGQNQHVGDAYITPGRTTNRVSFNPDGSYVMPEAVIRGNEAATPMDVEKYAKSFDTQVPRSEMFGIESLMQPRAEEKNVGNIDLGIGRPPDQASFDPDWIEQVLAAGNGQQSLKDQTQQMMSQRPMPDNIYQKAAAHRKAAMDRGEILTLTQIGKNLSSGESWASSLPESEEEYGAGGLSDILSSLSNPFDSAGRALGGMAYDWMNGEEQMNPADIPLTLASAEGRDGDPIKQGISRIQSQGTGRGDMGPHPESEIQGPPRDTSSDGGLASIFSKYIYPEGKTRFDYVKGSKIEFADLVAEQRAAGLDTSDLTARARKDAWSSALMQLGAGIAGNDLSGGLQRAGVVATSGMRDARRMQFLGDQSIQNAQMEARKLELTGRTAESGRQKDLGGVVSAERDALFNRELAKHGTTLRELTINSWKYKNMNDSQRYQFDLMKFAASTLVEQVSVLSRLTDEEKADKQLQLDDLTAAIISMALDDMVET